MPQWFVLLTAANVLAYAAVGGVFLAFSDFLMRSMARSPQGDATMRSVNQEVFRSVFMVLFLTLTPVSLGVAIFALVHVGGAGGALLAGAGGLYLVGVFLVTALFNVPMNNALAQAPDGTADAMTYWTDTYLPRWTFWNSLRAGACMGAATLTLLALLPL